MGNLAPAQERKEGSGLDLAIALAVLAATGQAPPEQVDSVAAVAELGLDGGLRPVRGALAIAEGAAAAGIERVVMAPENAAEAALVSGVTAVAARSLNEAVDILCGRAEPAPVPMLRSVDAAQWPDLGAIRKLASSR